MPHETDATPATSREVALIKDRIETQMGRQRTQLERTNRLPESPSLRLI